MGGALLRRVGFERKNYQCSCTFKMFTLTIKFEDISIARQLADVGCSIRVDNTESEELGRPSFGAVFQVRGVLLFFRQAILRLRTHLVVHGFLFS